ncbi:hypothetical protein DAPPUDRAFT_340651 [Daphnia pulex]|uniref:Uncharacterized protein n=1 Tax=Daphnia pulex TaxID=6669 RepID=E9I4I6_DAPPU|nr:hypothetical protein DAPPUDRAFT_340651 [Daphnia pulex]|eukprot:EFX61094.1 hypothetical protein DAPPUDRAFT_340651 [Daphnia pulex]
MNHSSADSAQVARSENKDGGDLQRLISSCKGMDALASSDNWLTSTLSHWIEERSDSEKCSKR